MNRSVPPEGLRKSLGPRPVTRRAGPIVVLVGLLALMTGLPSGHLSSFSPLHQLIVVFHVLLGVGFFVLFLLFIAFHVSETTDAQRAGLWVLAVVVYAFVREFKIREGVPWLFPFLYLGPIVLAWWVVDRRLRRAVVALAIGIPLVGLGCALVTGSAAFQTIFTLPYYAELLCLVSVAVGRPSVLGQVGGPNHTARVSGLFYTFATVGVGISGILAGLGAGQMQVGGAFLNAHRGTSLLLVIAALFHAAYGVGARRVLGMDETLGARLRRWALAAAIGGGTVAAGFAFLLHYAAVRDPMPERSVFVPSAMAAPSNWTVATGRTLDSLDFKDPQVCTSCHPTQSAQWSVSSHRFAASPAVRQLVAEARALRGPAAERYCLGCHAPRAVLTGELLGDGHASEESLDAGVGCLACHAVEGANGPPANASHVMANDTALLFERSGGYQDITRQLFLLTPRHHRIRYSKPYLRDPHICGGCHRQEQSSALGPHAGVLQDTFSSWSTSAYAQARPDGRPAADCAGCHMPRLWLSQMCEGIHDHRMFGGSAAAARARGDLPTAEIAAAWLRGDRAALIAEARSGFLREFREERFDTRLERLWEEKLVGREFPPEDLWPPGPLVGVDVQLERAPAGDAGARVAVSLTNRAIGHDFPAGPRDLIDAWLRLEVRDADGRTVLSSGGGADAPGSDARRFGGEAVDPSGAPITRHRIWEVAQNRGDRVLAPKATVVESFPLPTDLSSFRRPFTAEAELLYRFPGARITRELLGDTAPTAAPATLGHAMVSIP